MDMDIEWDDGLLGDKLMLHKLWYQIKKEYFKMKKQTALPDKSPVYIVYAVIKLQICIRMTTLIFKYSLR